MLSNEGNRQTDWSNCVIFFDNEGNRQADSQTGLIGLLKVLKAMVIDKQSDS